MTYQWGKVFTATILKRRAWRSGAGSRKITVFAAASLTNALQDIATQYQKEKGA